MVSEPMLMTLEDGGWNSCKTPALGPGSLWRRNRGSRDRVDIKFVYSFWVIVCIASGALRLNTRETLKTSTICMERIQSSRKS